MRWSMDTAEVRSARKGRHAVSQLLGVSEIPDWDGGGREGKGMDEENMLAQDSVLFRVNWLAQCLPVSMSCSGVQSMDLGALPVDEMKKLS